MRNREKGDYKRLFWHTLNLMEPGVFRVLELAFFLNVSTFRSQNCRQLDKDSEIQGAVLTKHTNPIKNEQ